MANIKSVLSVSAVILIIIMGSALNFSVKRISELKKDNNRLSGNQEILMSDIKQYVTKDSLNGVQTKALHLTVREMEFKNDSLKRVLNERDIRIKDLHSAQKIDLELSISDKLTPLPVIIEGIKCAEYNDGLNKLDICWFPDKNPEFNLQSKIGLQIYVHKQYKRKFLFFRWGSVILLQDVISNNKKCTITDAELIWK